MRIQDVQADEFKEILEKSEVPVVVDFWAAWCAPCRVLSPMLERAAEDWGDKARVLKVNADDNPELAAQYGIMGLPTVLVLKGGKEMARIVGVRPENMLRQEIERHFD
ncbi:MAG: thioredoxin [Bacillota bacterium]|nr:thioredoxin [Bacillota bacterium]